MCLALHYKVNTLYYSFQGTVGLPVLTEPLAKFIITGNLGEVTKGHFETEEQQQLAEKV